MIKSLAGRWVAGDRSGAAALLLAEAACLPGTHSTAQSLALCLSCRHLGQAEARVCLLSGDGCRGRGCVVGRER